MGFKQHEPCTNCGSRDNFARYDDGGGFCFGCHYTEKRTHAPMRHMGSEGDEKYHHAMPDDCGQLFPEAVVNWLGRFHMDVPTAIRHGVVWSPSREQLIYTLGNCWQARNFREGSKVKNFTSGDVNGCLHIYSAHETQGMGGTSESSRGGQGRKAGGTARAAGDECLHIYGELVQEEAKRRDRLVIVEDPVSALRVACSGSPVASMPLLGSHLAQGRLNAVAGLYDDLVFWLDSDKYREGRAMEQRAKYMGLSARTIYTDLDPKEYDNATIMEILS